MYIPDKAAGKGWHVNADDWTWVTTRRQRKKRKVLAGFARATGDRALTASIHDLVVLPELQGLGLGRKLLAKATNQVTACSGLTMCCWSLVRLENVFMPTDRQASPHMSSIHTPHWCHPCYIILTPLRESDLICILHGHNPTVWSCGFYAVTVQEFFLLVHVANFP